MICFEFKLDIKSRMLQLIKQGLQMKSVTLLFFIVLVSYSEVLQNQVPQAGPTQCQQYYIYTKERGCIKSCDHPDFKNCPDAFIAIWDPKFCALSKDGVWQSFTFACQACLSNSIQFVGVADGKCEQKPPVTTPTGNTGSSNPPSNTNTPSNAALPTTLPTSTSGCKQHEIYTKERGCISACSDPKWKQCGDVFPLLYSPKFCALGKDGKWTSFTFACQACPNSYPDTNYLGVDDGACPGDQIVFPPIIDPPTNKCKQNQVYTERRGCISACSDPKWKQCGDFFPAIWDPKFCALGKDGEWKSFTFACQACGNDYPDTEYVGVDDGICEQDIEQNPVDKCALILCQEGTKCQNGVCIPIDKCATIRCKQGTRCVNGNCVNNPPPIQNCALVLCQPGTRCVNGKCIPAPQNNSTNPPSTTDCSLVLCPAGQKCENGKCVPINPPNSCALILCKEGTKCENGVCVPINPPNSCALVLCKQGTRCIQGKCVPIAIQPNVYVCPVNSLATPRACTQPRPDNTSCPVIYWFVPPPPLFCGIRADGTRVNFPRECQACKQKSIVYYFNQPCHKTPFVCDKKDDCSGNGAYCANVKCGNPQECPYDWQTCLNGTCQDPCVYMKCANCKYGQCAFEQANGACTQYPPTGTCKNNWVCVGKECADVCLRTPCLAYQRCNPKNGVCEPTKTTR